MSKIDKIYLIAMFRKGINKKKLYNTTNIMNIPYSLALQVIENYQIDVYGRIIIL